MATRIRFFELIRDILPIGVLSSVTASGPRNRLPRPRTISTSSLEARLSQRYRLLFENLEYVVFTLAADGTITFISPAIERLSGYKACEVEGQPFSLFVFQDDLPGLQASFERTCSGQLQPYEFRTVSKDGLIRWVRSSSCPCLGPDGSVLEFAGIIADITIQRQMEQELRRNQATLEQAGRMAQLGAWDIEIWNHEDMKANPLRWSNEVYRIFGYEPGEVDVNCHLFVERVHPEDRQKVLDAFALTVRNKSACSLEHRIITTAGHERTVLEHAELMYDEHGQTNRIIGALQDITDQKMAESALIRSEKLASVGRMAATVAHEINNPLAAVMNLLFLARDNEPLSLQSQRYLDMADEELRRISHITSQALGFYRESCVPSGVSLETIVDSVLDLLRSKIKSKHVRLEKQFGPVLDVVGIPGELRQVFSNLLANSLDAIEEHGRITVRVSNAPWTNSDRPFTRVTIADNGAGIPSTDLLHIFEPFFTTKGSVGTGLGLWVTKQIVDKHTINSSPLAHGRPAKGNNFLHTVAGEGGAEIS